MPLTFSSLSSPLEERRAKRRELERHEVERGLRAYLLRTAVLVFSVMAFVMSSLTLWRSFHPGFYRPSGSWIIGLVIFWLAFALSIALWEFRRKRKRVLALSAGAAPPLC